MKKIFAKFLCLLVLLVSISGCNDGVKPAVSSTSNAVLDPSSLVTTNTDALKLSRSYEGKKFTEDGIGVLTMGTVMDGDTVHFMEDWFKVKLRFIGVNTPESTGKMEPWGKPASVYVRDLLNTAGITIVVENDIAVFGQKDNNGNRYLGFVWYKLPSMTDFRLLNLELIELGFSNNQLFVDSTLCPYRPYFEAAELNAIAHGIRLHGQQDPTFDYSNEVHAISLRTIREQYDVYGANDSSGKQLRVTALVVGMIGDNMVLRDVNEEDRYEDGTFAGLYAYAGYNTGLASVVKPGMLVSFNCRATKFNDAIQLSDLKTSFQTTRNPFKIEAKDLAATQVLFPLANMDTEEITGSNYTAYGQLERYVGRFVETEVTIRNADRDEYDEDGNPITVTGHYNKDQNKNITIYAYLKDSKYGSNSLVMNLRIDGTMFPYPNEQYFEVGATYRVKGYLNPYFDKYQIQLFNNLPEYQYIVKVS